MAEVADLLPQNETVWEKANELTDAEAVADLDATVIWKVKDALLCDERFLAVLGWERSVDVWDETWPLEKKRFVVDQWFAYERLKGTPEGFRRFLGLVGTNVVTITSPPQHPYPSRNWTADERAAYLAQFQQIRIYPRVPVVEFQDGFFVSNASGPSADFVGNAAPTAYSVTIDTVVREARLYEPRTNSETVLTRREIVSEVAHVGTVYQYEDILLPATRFGFYVGDYVGPFSDDNFLNHDDAPERTLRVEIQRPYGVALTKPQWTSVIPDAQLISLYPELVREHFTDQGKFVGHLHLGAFEELFGQRDTAWQHVYEKFHLYDSERDRGVTAGEPGDFVGHARLGMTAYTAELKVEIRGKRHTWEFVDFPGGIVTPDDRRKLDQTLEATRACKAGRDTIYLITKTSRKRQFGDRAKFGDRIVLGAHVEDI